MKKTLFIGLFAILALNLSAQNYRNGVYFAAEPDFSERTGWRYCVTLVVRNGSIVSADWNGAHKDAGPDKKTMSRSGEYGMVARGNASAEWHVQAERTEEHLLEIQDPTDIRYTNDAGNTDAISGVSIHVVEFFSLAEEALDRGPVGYGPYQDGSFAARMSSFSSQTGWKDVISVTVIGGRIMAVNWNAVHKDGGPDKKTMSRNGDYGMAANGGAQAAWHVQAERVENWILRNQQIDVDAVSGVSINFGSVQPLLNAALKRR